MKKLVLPLLLLFISAGCFAKNSKLAEQPCATPYSSTILIKNIKLCAEIVSTPNGMSKGLSRREKLKDEESMLFDFRESFNPVPTFWMKDMKFSLDLIWIKGDKIISITKNVPAPRNAEENRETNLKTYSAPSAIDYVLEVNSGWSDRSQVKAGDEIKF